MSFWKEVKLKEVTSLIKRVIAPKYVETDGYPIINQKCIRDNTVSYENSKLINKSQRVNKEKYLQDGDILVNSTGTGTLGRVAQYKFIGDNIFCDTHVSIVRANDTVDKDFLAYQLSYKESMIENYGKGATNQIELASSDLGLLKIQFPSLSIQKKIAQVLSNYDELIENNFKRIKLLEESARLTYEEWFLRFRIDGKKLEIDSGTDLPFGWKKVRSDQVLDVNIGKTPPRGEVEWFTGNNKGIKWISIKDMKKSSTYIFKTSEEITMDGVSKFNMNIAKKDTVILSFKLTVGEVRIVTEDMVTNEAIAHMNIKNNSILFKEYIFLYLKSFNFDTLGSTSSIGTAINSKIVKAMPIIVPSKEVMKELKKVITPLFISIENLQKQNQFLQEARDILLPRLMTGMIDVDNMEVAV